MPFYKSQLVSLLISLFITLVLETISMVYIILKPCDSLSYFILLGLFVVGNLTTFLECILYVYSKKTLRYILLNISPINGCISTILYIVSLLPEVEKECKNTPIHPLLITFLVLSLIGTILLINNSVNNKTDIDFLVESEEESPPSYTVESEEESLPSYTV